MRLGLRHLSVTAIAAACAFASANQAHACWNRRVYTSYYVDPCVSCVTPSVQSCATGGSCSTCPISSCATACEPRCYLESQVGYRVVTRLEPQTAYIRRSYYDPYRCCDRSYLIPTTQFVQRSYQIPVTTYVQRCCSEPVCPASYESPAAKRQSNGSDEGSQSGEGKGLERPIFREPAPAPAPLPDSVPKPVPMPSPQTRRGGQRIESARLQIQNGTL